MPGCANSPGTETVEVFPHVDSISPAIGGCVSLLLLRRRIPSEPTPSGALPAMRAPAAGLDPAAPVAFACAEGFEMIALRLTGSRCRCSACGEAFNSTSVFDRHRVGGWQGRGADRRCLSQSEMRARGWDRNAHGFWIERRTSRERIEKLRPRRNPDCAEVSREVTP